MIDRHAVAGADAGLAAMMEVRRTTLRGPRSAFEVVDAEREMETGHGRGKVVAASR